MKRILVVLPNWYGETLFTTPFLRCLREQNPDAFIATLGRPLCREVLLYNSHLNELIDLDEQGAHRGLLGKLRLIVLLRPMRFDQAFILRRSLSRTLVLALSGIRERVGFDNPKSGLLLTQRIPSSQANEHKAATYLHLLDGQGPGKRPIKAKAEAEAKISAFDYKVSPEEREANARWIKSKEELNGRALIVLHPGANWEYKRWDVKRFAELGDRLRSAYGVQIAVTGGPDDVPLAKALARQMKEPPVLLAGQTRLREMAAFLEGSRLVVSNDTGVLHVAAALGRPIVALFGPTSPQRTGPMGDTRRIAVLHHPECYEQMPCYEQGPAARRGMDAISVDEAYQAASRLLEQEAGFKGHGQK